MKRWMLTEGLPALVELNTIPMETPCFNTELEAVNVQIAILNKIQMELDRRQFHLEYKQQEKQYEDAGILKRRIDDARINS